MRNPDRPGWCFYDNFKRLFCREMMLMVLTETQAVILFVKELFYRAILTPLICPLICPFNLPAKFNSASKI